MLAIQEFCQSLLRRLGIDSLWQARCVKLLEKRRATLNKSDAQLQQILEPFYTWMKKKGIQIKFNRDAQETVAILALWNQFIYEVQEIRAKREAETAALPELQEGATQ